MTTTEGDTPDGLRLTVLNPGGRDPEQDFAEGAPAPNDNGHAPVNFHGYAACTRGTFQHDYKRAIEIGRPVLLLLRSDFKETRRALLALQKGGLPAVVSLKETGLHQIARQLADPAVESAHERLQHVPADTSVLAELDDILASHTV